MSAVSPNFVFDVLVKIKKYPSSGWISKTVPKLTMIALVDGLFWSVSAPPSSSGNDNSIGEKCNMLVINAGRSNVAPVRVIAPLR